MLYISLTYFKENHHISKITYISHIMSETEVWIPYYMAYPLPLQYDDERKERRDYEYMKSLYPDVAKRLLPYIEEECDRMEYDNSMMYDEYPDRLQLHLMCKRVCENVRKHEKIFYGTEYEGLLSQAEENSVMQMEEAERMQEPESEWEPEFMQVQEQNRREPERRRMPNWLQNLIEVMLYHELYKRRSDHRRSRHRIY